MIKHNSATRTSTLGDLAVDGLLAGVISGAFMAGYLAAAGLTWGNNPGTTFGLFDPGDAQSPVVGLITHLAVSGVYGLIFGAGWGALTRVWRRFPAWLAGALYGFGLLAFALFILLPASESPLLLVPPVHFAVAHLIYGIGLGLAAGRRATRP